MTDAEWASLARDLEKRYGSDIAGQVLLSVVEHKATDPVRYAHRAAARLRKREGLVGDHHPGKMRKLVMVEVSPVMVAPEPSPERFAIARDELRRVNPDLAVAVFEGKTAGNAHVSRLRQAARRRQSSEQARQVRRARPK